MKIKLEFLTCNMFYSASDVCRQSCRDIRQGVTRRPPTMKGHKSLGRPRLPIYEPYKKFSLSTMQFFHRQAFKRTNIKYSIPGQ